MPDGRSFHQILVNGDSYRSQRANKLHFGLGNYGAVESVRILWPDKHEQIIPRPRINAYYKFGLD